MNDIDDCRTALATSGLLRKVKQRIQQTDDHSKLWIEFAYRLDQWEGKEKLFANKWSMRQQNSC